MYRLEREEFVKPEYVSLWGALGFQAGFLNAFGFLACGRYVSHVTGFGTQIGIAMAQQSVWFAVELLGFPLSFILGAFTSGVVTSARIERGKKPRYAQVILLLPIAIATLLALGELGLFGVFGEQLIRTRDFVLLFMLSFVCGLQNGCFATLTKGQVRTTHLTGISTDIGTDLARIWFGKLGPAELAFSKQVNFSRITTFVLFAAGSITSALVSQPLAYRALWVPFVTSTAIFIVVMRIGHRLDKKLATENTIAIQSQLAS